MPAQILKLIKRVKGRCAFCCHLAFIEQHHVSYRPERRVGLCHKCHFKVHFFPQHLTEREIRILVNAKYQGAALRVIYHTKKSLDEVCAALKHSLTLRALHDEKSHQKYRELAPSRKAELARGFKKRP